MDCEVTSVESINKQFFNCNDHTFDQNKNDQIKEESNQWISVKPWTACVAETQIVT